MKSLAVFLHLAVLVTAQFLNAQQISLLDDTDKVPGDNPLSYCENPKDYTLSIDQVMLIPNPPKAGQNLTVFVNGTLSKAIEDGAKVLLTLKLGAFPLIKKKVDLCEEVESGNATCPLDKGDVKWEKVLQIPGAVPPGTYTVIADAWSEDVGQGDEVTCLTGNVKFG